MKRFAVVTISMMIVALFSASVIMANPKIKALTVKGKKVHEKTAAGAQMTCNFCHVTAGIKKEKLGLMKGQAKYATLAQKKECSGAGCHK